MIYLSSTTDSSGTSRIELTFGPKSAVSNSPIPTVLPYYLRGHGALCGGRPYPYASALCFNPQACTEGIRAAEGSSGPLRPFLLWFERVFFRFRDMIVPVVGHSLGRLLRYIIVYILIVAGLAFIFLRMPTSYLPNEDQGVLLLEVIHPSGSTLEKTEDILDQVSDYFLTNEKEGVESFGWAAGVSLAGMGQNMCIGFVKLKDWKFCDRREERVWAVQERAMTRFSQINTAMVFAFPPPPIVELGNATGFEFELLDFAGQGHHALMVAGTSFWAWPCRIHDL